MRLPLWLSLLTCLLASCGIFKSSATRRGASLEREIVHSPVFSKAFTGFTLLDPGSGKTLADVQGDHYFTPASNTKILTLATCLEVMGDSVPGLQYTNLYGGSTIIRGTGDPTFLHPAFIDFKSTHTWMKSQKQLYYLTRENIPRFGPGWAWDDYNEPYSTERSDFPVFGNMVLLQKENGLWKCTPKSLMHRLGIIFSEPNNRISEDISRFEYYPAYSSVKPDSAFQDGFRQYVPIPFHGARWDPFIDVMRDTLGMEKIILGGYEDFSEPIADSTWHTLYSTPIDTVLRRMMFESDNFVAEQMLLAAAGEKFGILQQDTLIKWMLDSVLTTLPQRPNWVDGSGLSRYNLVSPQDIAQVLLRLWRQQPRERLLSLFPAGGVRGTIENWYAGKDGKPYVFAKTGSMGGVHCLSGYVACKSGKVLIFSFMHNNFVGSNRPWKQEMQRLLEWIAARY